MTADNLAQLASTPLFKGLTESEIQRIVEVGRIEYWREGAFVLEEGDFGPRMMVLLTGEVEILRRDDQGIQRVIATAGPGEILGEMSLLLDLPRTATVRALGELRCFAMDRSAFEEMVDGGDPAILKFGLQLSKALANRLLKLNERVVNLIAANAEPTADLKEDYGTARQQLFTLWEY